MVHGSDPPKFGPRVDVDVLPAARAPGCKAEYEKQSAAREGLLRPFLKKK